MDERRGEEKKDMPRSGKIISGCIINSFHIFYYSDSLF